MAIRKPPTAGAPVYLGGPAGSKGDTGATGATGAPGAPGTNATVTAASITAALANLPTTLPAAAGQLWWNGGTLSST